MDELHESLAGVRSAGTHSKLTLHLKSYENLNVTELSCLVYLCGCSAFLSCSSFFGGETLIYVQSKI